MKCQAIILLTVIVLCTGCNKGTGNITQSEIDDTVTPDLLSAPADYTVNLQTPEDEVKPSLPKGSFVYTESGYIYTESGSFYIDVINGVWEYVKHRYTRKYIFSWGENVSCFEAVLIDLNSSDGLYIALAQGNVFYGQEKELRGNQVVLTGHIYDEPNERREIIITIIDENTISIDAGDYLNWLINLFRPEDDPTDYFYRVPFDAPYEPYLPGEDM